MNFVEKNQNILNRWRVKFVKDFGKENEYRFADDGIMNKGECKSDSDGRWWRETSKTAKENDLWTNAPLRVLFLTKDENRYDNAAWDVRKETFHAQNSEWEQNEISSSFFFRNEANILYGILHTTPYNMVGFEEFSINDAVEFSDNQIFARINCKKEGGGGRVENVVLQTAIDNDYLLLKEQILNIDADILICCGSQGEENITLDLVRKIYDKEFEYCDYGTKKGTAVHYNEKRKKLAIDIYHLAYSRYGGEIARYYEAVGAYYSFIKFLKNNKGIDFTESHRKPIK